MDASFTLGSRSLRVEEAVTLLRISRGNPQSEHRHSISSAG